MSSLEGLGESASITYLNLRGNQIPSVGEIAILSGMRNLNTLVLQGNLIENIDQYRLEVLITLPQLKKLDKDAFEEDEREEAKDLLDERKEKEAPKKVEEVESTEEADLDDDVHDD